jgi:hypothetical protein
MEYLLHQSLASETFVAKRSLRGSLQNDKGRDDARAISLICGIDRLVPTAGRFLLGIAQG